MTRRRLAHRGAECFWEVTAVVCSRPTLGGALGRRHRDSEGQKTGPGGGDVGLEGAGPVWFSAMDMMTVGLDTEARERLKVPVPELDFALTAQIVVAWAGEGGEEPRLGWWRCDLVSEFGGEDLFRRLLPHTWQWAVLQGVREAARRKDAELRAKDHDPDQIVSLYSLGFELDERLDERFRDLKLSGAPPRQALAGLSEGLLPAWDREKFLRWVSGHGSVEASATPAGRCLRGSVPASLEQAVRQLVAALAPLGEAYPLPHFREDTGRRGTSRSDSGRRSA